MTVSTPKTGGQVRFTSAPRMATPPGLTRRGAPSTVMLKAPGAGTEPASRGSSKTRTSVSLSTPADARWNDGGPVTLCSAASRKFATRLPAASRNAFAHSAAP